MSKYLKSCPFCGGTNVEVIEWGQGYGTVRCMNCHFENPNSAYEACTVSGAIERWNTRAKDVKDVQKEKCEGSLRESEGIKEVEGNKEVKSDYCDMIFRCKSPVTSRALARDYGVTEGQINFWLRDLGVLYQGIDEWEVCPRYSHSGYFRRQIGWTRQGRLFIYEILKKHGILPLVEQEGSR